MAVAKWTPRAEWETLRHKMDRLVERALPRMMVREVEAQEVRWPRLDVRKTDTAYMVETDLPGMTAEAITVEAEGPHVVVKGERRAEYEAGEGEMKRTERTFGTFYRRVALPKMSEDGRGGSTV